MFWRRSPKPRTQVIIEAAEDPTSFSNLVMKLAGVTQDQIDRAVAYQNDHVSEILGDVMVKLGILDRETADYILAKQQEYREMSSDTMNSLLTLDLCDRSVQRTNGGKDRLVKMADMVTVRLAKKTS